MTDPSAAPAPAPASSPVPTPAANRGRRLPGAARLALYLVIVAGAAAGLWYAVGRQLWSEYQTLQKEVRASEDNAPVGYVGLNYRRSYNDRPVVFLGEKDQRKTLFAARGADGQPEVYDVTDAAIDLQCLDGGFGRDSIPGVDYPIIDPPDSNRGRSLRERQPIFGALLRDGPRAYPKDLLEKIEVVNDRDGKTPIVVVYIRGEGRARLFDRTIAGAPVTFGTTGYSCRQRPLLYDRKTRSLWLPEGDDLVCVNGPLKGTKAAPYLTLESTTWGAWHGQHSESTVLVGNDRSQPIPAE